MKTILSYALLAVLICAATSPLHAQDQRNEQDSDNHAISGDFGIGIIGALHQFTGDVQDKSGGFFEGAENPLGFGGNLFAKYRVGELDPFGSLHFFGRVGYHPQKGEFQNAQGRQFDFENNILQFSVGAQVELFPESRIRPFGKLGIGLIMSDPTIKASPYYVNRAEFHTGESEVTGSIPGSVGFLFTVAENIDIVAEFEKTLVFSDNLDGWESEVNDNWQSFGLGVVIYFGGDDEEEPAPPPPPPAPVDTDTDDDGLEDESERTVHKTDPTNKDTDGDRLIDGDEVNQYSTDPLNKDTDNDALQDGAEVLTHKTNPLNKDTDGDGCSDGDEVNNMKTNPLVADTDGDGLNDCEERDQYRTNPLVQDTDGDGALDGREIEVGTDPLVADVLKLDDNADITLEGINFKTASAEILPESETILTQAYNTLRVNADLRVEIQGHTDDRGMIRIISSSVNAERTQ